MIIKSLALENFRNYENLHISFSDDINLFYGNNAQGKTNILEAIYLLATTKSHRKSNDKEIIKFSKSNSFIKGIFIEKNLDLNVELQLSKNEKKNLFVNKLKLSKIRDYIGKINIIFFSPEDLKILKSSPNVRRLFIDMEICQINKIYMDILPILRF